MVIFLCGLNDSVAGSLFDGADDCIDDGVVNCMPYNVAADRWVEGTKNGIIKDGC